MKIFVFFGIEKMVWYLVMFFGVEGLRGWVIFLEERVFSFWDREGIGFRLK